MSAVAYPFHVLQVQASFTAVTVAKVDVEALNKALHKVVDDAVRKFCERPELTTGPVAVSIESRGALTQETVDNN